MSIISKDTHTIPLGVRFCSESARLEGTILVSEDGSVCVEGTDLSALLQRLEGWHVHLVFDAHVCVDIPTLTATL